MTTALLWLASLGGVALGIAVICGLIRHSRKRDQSASADSDSDLRGSNANFGNSLRGDNSSFGRGFYDE